MNRFDVNRLQERDLLIIGYPNNPAILKLALDVQEGGNIGEGEIKGDCMSSTILIVLGFLRAILKAPDACGDYPVLVDYLRFMNDEYPLAANGLFDFPLLVGRYYSELPENTQTVFKHLPIKTWTLNMPLSEWRKHVEAVSNAHTNMIGFTEINKE